MVSDRQPCTWLSWALVGTIALAGTSAAALRGQAAPPLTQYQVEAAFLYHFAKYVTWPAHAFVHASDPLLIGVLGEDPFGDELTETISREKPVHGRPLRVVRSRSVADLARCHILFISDSEQPRLAQHFAALDRARSPALTVGESESFLEVGGVVRFVVEKNKVRFDIRAANAERAGLTISSKLLSLARNKGEKT